MITVTPGTVYTINVGGGGLSYIPFGRDATDGATSSMTLGSVTLIYARGGGDSGAPVGGFGDFSAAINGRGYDADGTGAGDAFGWSFCPNGPTTGQGGQIFSGGAPGYVLLVW